MNGGGGASPGEEMLGFLLDISRTLPPDRLPDAVAVAVALIGGTDVCIYLVDREQRTLLPVKGSGDPAGDALEINTTLGGRAYRVEEMQIGEAEGGRRVWVPIVDGTDRLGIIGVTLPETDPLTLRRLSRFGSLVGELVVSKSAYGDALVLGARTRNMTLAAELRWTMLPPLNFESDDAALAGVLEPAYDVAGDCFDYAYNGETVHVAIFDAMGHGLEASRIANLAVGGYRHARRLGLSLRETLAGIDAVVAEQFSGDRFVTAQLATLSVPDGRLRWVNAGHPPPMLLRAGRVVGDLHCPPRPPLGIGPAEAEIAELALEPGDTVVFLTDGVTEAPSPTGELFGRGRLADLLERAAASHEKPAEMVRRLVHAVLAHVDGEFRDDATVLLLRWRPRAGPA